MVASFPVDLVVLFFFCRLFEVVVFEVVEAFFVVVVFDVVEAFFCCVAGFFFCVVVVVLRCWVVAGLR